MHRRVEGVGAPFGWRTLQIKQEWIGEHVIYVGAIDGKWCVSSPSRERTVQALLRKAMYKADC